MLLIMACIGLIIGALINALSDLLPRFARDEATRRETRQPTWTPAALRFLAAIWRRCVAVAARVASGQRHLPNRVTTSTISRLVWLDLTVEMFMALLTVYIWQELALSPAFYVLLPLCALLVLIAVIDLKYQLILNVVVYPATIGMLLYHLLPPGRMPLWALAGGAAALALFWLAARVSPSGLGGGDIKLAALIGVIFGFPYFLWALLVGVLVGGAAAVLLMSLGGRSRSSAIPYAPFLCLGAILALFYNPFSFL